MIVDCRLSTNRDDDSFDSCDTASENSISRLPTTYVIGFTVNRCLSARTALSH